MSIRLLALLLLASSAALADFQTREIGDKNYVIGEEKTSYVGEPMIRSKSYMVSSWEEEVYTPTVTFWFKLTVGPDTRFGAGTELRKKGTEWLNGKVYTELELPSPMLKGYRLMIDENNLFIGYVKGQHKVISAGANVFIAVRPREVQFEKKSVTRARRDAMATNHEIIYSGKTKDAINLFYREYTENDYARPAFSQNLIYEPDLKRIRFRNTVIRIVEVSGESIRFVVEADGSKP